MTKYLGWSVLFDLDGTLVETAPDLRASLNHVLVGEGLTPVPLSVIRGMIGEGAKALLRKGYAFNGVDLVCPIETERLWRKFITYYEGHIADHSYVFEGARETLIYLQDHGVKLAVCTNKVEYLAKEVLDALDLTQFFGAIVGSDTVSVKKPNAAHVLETLERLGGDRHQTLFIGDSQTDARAAENAGIPFIFVPFGYENDPVDAIKKQALMPNFNAFKEVFISLTVQNI